MARMDKLEPTVRPRLSLLVSLSLATFVLAFVAAAQFRSQPIPPSNQQARDQALRSSVYKLEARNRQLTGQVNQLQGQVQALETEAAGHSSAAQEAEQALAGERALVGMVPLHGPGVIVTLHDAPSPNDPNDQSLGWVVHFQDLQDIVNLLWASGAEAITVNQQRVVPDTSFFYAGVNLLVNNASRITSPYVIAAIGDQPALEAGLQNPGQLSELKSRNDVYGLGLTWRAAVRVAVPAFTTTFILHYAQPITS
jgi:uncharacterized protein YlxW (UPF0749 family)